MKNLLVVAVAAAALALVACTPPYGRQSCNSSSECPMGQVCPTVCLSQADGGVDAGAPITVMGICALPCATDADCANLGLKKPVCATYTCTGTKQCTDNPF